LKPIKNTAYGKNGSSKSSGLSGVIIDTDKASENYFMLQLQEMEELNAHLEKRAEQLTKELTEVVATNSKFISINST
jgi:hypothetical protein